MPADYFCVRASGRAARSLNAAVITVGWDGVLLFSRIFNSFSLPLFPNGDLWGGLKQGRGAQAAPWNCKYPDLV